MSAQQVDEHLKWIGDFISISTVIGTLAGMLPSVAALISIVWSSIRIYETKTVQSLLQKWKDKG
jgi:hypothetical protein